MPWLVVGLGNPGSKYRLSRHNVGFWAIDHISAQKNIPLSNKSHQALWGEGRIGRIPIILSKPQTFMNLSGLSIKSILDFFGMGSSRLIIVHDDMDLTLAEVRIREKGGSGGHKGIKSVIDQLGTELFLRIRIGIGRPDSDKDPVDHVLEPCPIFERDKLFSVIQKTDQMVEVIIKDGPRVAMNLFNH
ncbi:MAG: aminoacyl-tRNA hydrolase [bacterium]